MSASVSAPALPEAVLWDMDGTIVDTEPFWMAAEEELVRSFGGTWSHEQGLALVGQGLETSAAVLQAAGVRLPAPDIVGALTNRVRQLLLTQGPRFRPGAVELLTALRDSGVRCALVTMSLRRMAEDIVSRLPEGVLELIVAGDDVARPKPFPDAYVQACAALDLMSDRAVAIEDSPTGVRAAVAAGVATIGVPLMVSLAESGAHAVWPTLADRTPADLAAFHAARLSKGRA